VGFAYAATLVSPFLAGSTIAALAPARRFVARRHGGCAAVGWTAFALVLPAAILLDGWPSVAALALLCPLTALMWWRQTGSDDDDDDDPDPEPPDLPPTDWDRFMRDLDEYSTSRSAWSPLSGSRRS
jgi:hypothetical protein